MRRAVWMLALVALGVGGCVNQQKEVATYRAVLDQHFAATTQPVDAAAPLKLSAALARANGTSEQLAMAGEGYLQALIAKDRAAATFLPQISLAPLYSHVDTFSTAGFPSTFAAVFPVHYFDLPLKTSLDLNVVQDLADVHRAGRTAQQRRALLLDLQETVLLQTCDAFYDVLIAQQQVGVLEHSLAVQNQRVDSIQREFNAGTARQLDVLQSQADAAATQVLLTDARNRLATARSTLGFMIDSRSVPDTLLDDLHTPDAVPSAGVLTQRALAQRADLAAARRGVQAAEQAVRSAVGQYFPSIGLNLSNFLYRESFPSDSWWSAMVTANMPIFEAGIIHANVRSALSELRQAGLAERQLARRIAEQVAIARDNYLSSRQRLHDLGRELDAAQRAYEQAEHSFAAGTATNLDRLTAQDRALQAALQVASERYTSKLRYLHLARTLGRLEDAITPPATAGNMAPAKAATTLPTRPAQTQAAR